MTDFCNHYVKFFLKKEYSIIGANYPCVTGLILAENHEHAGKQGSTSSVLDGRMHNDKNTHKQLNPPRALLEQGLQLRKSCAEMYHQTVTL